MAIPLGSDQMNVISIRVAPNTGVLNREFLSEVPEIHIFL